MVPQVVRCRDAVGAQHHERLGPLAPAIVGHLHDGGLEDRRVAHDRLLHLDGGDVLAARDHDVLGAVAQLDVAVGVPHAEVSGVEHAALERLGRRRRVVVVALHDVVPGHDDLPHRDAVAGTSRPASSTTRIGSACTIATPWRASRSARAPGSSSSQPTCHWHTV